MHFFTAWIIQMKRTVMQFPWVVMVMNSCVLTNQNAYLRIGFVMEKGLRVLMDQMNMTARTEDAFQDTGSVMMASVSQWSTGFVMMLTIVMMDPMRRVVQSWDVSHGSFTVLTHKGAHSCWRMCVMVFSAVQMDRMNSTVYWDALRASGLVQWRRIGRYKDLDIVYSSRKMLILVQIARKKTIITTNVSQCTKCVTTSLTAMITQMKFVRFFSNRKIQ